MIITNIKIRKPVDVEQGVMAYCSIDLENALRIEDCKLVRLPHGVVHLCFPNRPARSPCPHCSAPCPRHSKFCGECGKIVSFPQDITRRYDSVHPLNSQVRKEFTKAVIAEYDRVLLLESELTEEPVT